MVDDNFIVSIDIGSSKIAILLAEEVNGRLRVFGHAKGKSAGVRKGVIIDVELATQAIKQVAKAAYLNCNTHFHNVSVNISDPNLTVINRAGQTLVLANEISVQDMDNAITNAHAVPTSANRQVISSMPNCYTLDKDPVTHQGIVVEQPIGQYATTLEVGVHIVSVSNQCVNAIEQSIRQSDLGLSNIVLNSMASSEAYITQEEKNNGVCLIDIGSAVSNLSVFTQGSITYSAIFQVGGDQITQDIVDAFNTSFEEAERLKLNYGNAQVKSITEDTLIKFQQIDDTKNDRYLSHQSLLEVIEAAYLALFSPIRQTLKSQKLYRSLKSGFVLTGGGAKIDGCHELLLNYFKIKTELGRINIDRITAEHRILDPVYACALGLLLFDPNEFDFRGVQSNNKRNILGKIKQQFKF